jgi:hypothetical protein
MDEHSPLATELIRAVEILSETFADRSIRYALIGGLATMMRGRPRFTQDVDVLLEVPQLSLPPLLDDLSSRGFSLDVGTVVKQFVQEHQDQADILTLFAANRADIDIDLIRREWQPYVDSEPSRTDWLEAAITRLVPS